MQYWPTLGVRPPLPDAPRAETWRFIRDMQLRTLLLSVPVAAAVVLFGDLPAWAVTTGVAGQVLCALDALYLTWRISREPG